MYCSVLATANTEPITADDPPERDWHSQAGCQMPRLGAARRTTALARVGCSTTARAAARRPARCRFATPVSGPLAAAALRRLAAVAVPVALLGLAAPTAVLAHAVVVGTDPPAPCALLASGAAAPDA